MNRRIPVEQLLGWGGLFMSALLILGLAFSPVH
jgi:hypothetical protein